MYCNLFLKRKIGKKMKAFGPFCNCGKRSIPLISLHSWLYYRQSLISALLSRDKKPVMLSNNDLKSCWFLKIWKQVCRPANWQIACHEVKLCLKVRQFALVACLLGRWWFRSALYLDCRDYINYHHQVFRYYTKTSYNTIAL